MNRFSKQKRHFPLLRSLALPLLIFVFVIVFLFQGMTSVSDATQKEEMKSLKNAVMKSAVHCYAAEGLYPESLEYLEEHYGITYDHNKYLVVYEAAGANLMPDVDVISLKNREVAP